MVGIIFFAVLVWSIVFMVNAKKKVADGQSVNDPLSTVEKVSIWIMGLVTPIVSDAILYFGWKKKLPRKAKQANRICIWAFIIVVVVAFGIAYISGLPGYTAETSPSLSTSAVATSTRTAIVEGLLNRYKVFDSNNPAQIRNYILTISTSSEAKSQINAASDQEILNMVAPIPGLSEPTMDLITDKNVDWEISSDSATLIVHSSDGNDSIYNLVNVSGTWY